MFAKNSKLMSCCLAVAVVFGPNVSRASRTIDPDVPQDGASFYEATKPAPESYEVTPAVRIEAEGKLSVGTFLDFWVLKRGFAASGTLIADECGGSARHVLTARHVVERMLNGGIDVEDIRVTQFDTAGNPTTHAVVSAWILPGESDVAILSIDGESSEFAIPAWDEPCVGQEFFFAGAGFAGADHRSGFDFGNNENPSDNTSDKGLDTRYGIMRRGENAVSGYGEANGRTVRFDVDIQGYDPFGDNATVPPLASETKMNALDSGTGFLVEEDGEYCVFGLTSGKPSDVTDAAQFATQGPSVAHYREWISRVLELDLYIAELRMDAELGLEAMEPLYSNTGAIRTAMDSGFGDVYAAEGAVAHVDEAAGQLVLPQSPQSLAERIPLESEATGHFLDAALLAFSAEVIAIEDEQGFEEEVAGVQDAVYAAAELCLYDVAMPSLYATWEIPGVDESELYAAGALLEEADSLLWDWKTVEGLQKIQAALDRMAAAVSGAL